MARGSLDAMPLAIVDFARRTTDRRDGQPARHGAGRAALRALAWPLAALALAACAQAPATCTEAPAVATLQARVADLEDRLSRAEYALVAVNRRALDLQQGMPPVRTLADPLPPAAAPHPTSAQSVAQSITASISRLLAANGAASLPAAGVRDARASR